MPSSFLQKFRRITYSTSYLPQVDGLRFLAIVSVVLVMHISHYMDEKFFNNQLTGGGYWANFIYEGGNGVPLFFMISGFILSLPFAKWRLQGGKKIRLKNYYLRRVTRLEPPYIIALLLLFIAHVWLLHKYSFAILLPHLFASVFYVHMYVFHSFSLVLPVAWSLEVEVQFYLLAPLFFLVFLIRSALVRRAIMLFVIIASSIIWFDVWYPVHVFLYLHFFFMGILLADLYSTDYSLLPGKNMGFLVGLFSLAGYLFIPTIHYMPGYFIKIALMFLLIHTVLTNEYMKRMFSARFIVLVGGMCYSLYLLHYAIVSFVGQMIMRSGIRYTSKALFVPFAILFILSVLILGAIFFLVVEKPFMKPLWLGQQKKD
jgi:peptidoglycan/LPS O-acetylase OafA/YrhL